MAVISVGGGTSPAVVTAVVIFIVALDYFLFIGNSIFLNPPISAGLPL